MNDDDSNDAAPTGYRMPDEAKPHTRTFMCWPSQVSIWGQTLLPLVQQDVAAIAKAIARYEPVVLCAGADQVEAAGQACSDPEVKIEIVEIATDDLWARDTGPTFVIGPDGLAGVDLNFNGWGSKPNEDGSPAQKRDQDAQVAARILARYGIQRIQASIVGEGGALEIDGEGTLMATESSLVNDNRNLGKSKNDIEAALKSVLGVERVIWFPGVKDKDITDCHVDALARFARPGVVVLNRPAAGTSNDTEDPFAEASNEALKILKESCDARERQFEIVELPEARVDRTITENKDFLASYVNYYVVNGAVILPKFGDTAADGQAASIVGGQYPNRTVVQVDITNLAKGGGGIHCATQQQPALGDS